MRKNMIIGCSILLNDPFFASLYTAFNISPYGHNPRKPLEWWEGFTMTIYASIYHFLATPPLNKLTKFGLIDP